MIPVALTCRTNNNLNPASYLVAGPDHNLPLEYGHLGHDGIINKSMQ